MKDISCFLLLFSCQFIFSQDKIEQLTQLYTHYESTCESETDSALYHINQAHTLALEFGDDDWLSKTNYALGYCYYLKREDSLSLFYTEKAVKLAKKEKNFNILSKGYTQIGQIYSLQNHHTKALEYLFHSLGVSKKNEKLIDNTVVTLTYIGDVFITEKDTLKGLMYYYKARNLGKQITSKRLDRTYSALGIFYMGTEKDSALFYLRKSVNLYKKNHHKYGEIHSRINIAVTILNFSSTKDYPEALKQLQIAKKLTEGSNNPDLIFFSNYFLGTYYENVDNNLLKAKSYYEEALRYMKEGYKNEYNIQLYKSLSRVAKNQGDYKTAYEYQVKSQILQDSVFSVEKNKQFHEIQTKFEVEQKNNRIELLNKENEIQSKQKLWILITAVILLLLVLIIAYVYKKEAKSQKLIRKQDLFIFEKEREAAEHQKKLSEVRYLIAGENNERSRISKELHDGIGSSVAAIQMNLEMLSKNEIKNNRLDLQIEQLNHVSKEIRIISHALSTGIDSEKTLLELINDLVKIHRFDRKFQMQMTIFPEDCLNDLDDFFKINLYRIFQEVFANISKHSQASKVDVSCTLHDGQFSIIIEDDGVGFESEVFEGIGIKNIKERTKELNGEVYIDSKKNHGTTISILVPKHSSA